jgi:hypothetical protein
LLSLFTASLSLTHNLAVSLSHSHSLSLPLSLYLSIYLSLSLYLSLHLFLSLHLYLNMLQLKCDTSTVWISEPKFQIPCPTLPCGTVTPVHRYRIDAVDEGYLIHTVGYSSHPYCLGRALKVHLILLCVKPRGRVSLFFLSLSLSLSPSLSFPLSYSLSPFLTLSLSHAHTYSRSYQAYL